MEMLHPQEGQQPSYAQLNIYDEQATLSARNSHNTNLNHGLMGELQDMLNANNPFVPLYMQAYQIIHESPPEMQANIHMSIVLQPEDDHY
jgi:hypothetical protein